jgi:hypothetical protein
MKKRHSRKQRNAAKLINRRGPNRKRVAPGTADEFFSKSEAFQDLWKRITNAVSKMRAERITLPVSSKYFGLDSRTVVQWARPALRKGSNGRYVAKSHDSLLRVLVILTSNGLQEIATNDSREASLLSKYWAAVEKYLQTGDASALRNIRRKTVINSDGKRVRLIKDLAELDRLGSAGVLSFESIYAKAA